MCELQKQTKENILYQDILNLLLNVMPFRSLSYNLHQFKKPISSPEAYSGILEMCLFVNVIVFILSVKTCGGHVICVHKNS